MFEIFNIFHKAEFQYHHIYDCDFNTCKENKRSKKKKKKKKTNAQICDFFLCWQRTGIILRLKWVYPDIGT